MLQRYRREALLGVGLALAGLAWVTGEFVAGLHGPRIDLHPIVTNLFAFVPIALIVAALRARRRDDGGLTWRSGIASGLVLSAANSALAPVTLWLFARWINPGFFPAMTAHAVRTGQASRAEAEAYFNLGSYVAQSMVFSLVAGFVTSLIVTAVLRRTGPPTEALPAPAAVGGS